MPVPAGAGKHILNVWATLGAGLLFQQIDRVLQKRYVGENPAYPYFVLYLL